MYDIVYSANTGAGEHGDGEFGNAGQIEGDSVSFLYTERFEHISTLADLFVQVTIGSFAAIRAR